MPAAGSSVPHQGGQLAIDILTEVLADGVRLDLACGDEVYGSCTELREFCEAHGRGYVLRVPSSFRLAVAAEVTLSCAGAVTRLLHDARRWEVRSAGAGSKASAGMGGRCWPPPHRGITC